MSWFARPKGCKFSKSQPGMISIEKLLCARQGAKTQDLFLIGGYSFFLFESSNVSGAEKDIHT